MADRGPPDIAGLRLLVVEDDYWIASDLSFWLESKGAKVLGPAASVASALEILTIRPAPDAALLDVNLGDEQVFPVADALTAADVPFIFLSGHDAGIIPKSYRDAPCCTKPLDRPGLLRAVAERRRAATR